MIYKVAVSTVFLVTYTNEAFSKLRTNYGFNPG